MPVIVNNKRILPAPIVSFSKAAVAAENGLVIGANFSISMQGYILQNKGNPIATSGANFASSYSTDPWTQTYSPDDDPIHGIGPTDLLMSTVTKLEQLRDLFSPATGIKVEIVGFNHAAGLRFYGDLKEFSVGNEGNWATPATYNIEVGCNNFISPANSGLFSDGSTEDGFAYYIESAGENWGFQEGDVVVDTGNWNNVRRTYNVTHSVQAKGKRAYATNGELLMEPWQQASGYVISQIGLGSGNLPDSILGITSGYFATNYKVSETVDKLGGAYSVEETYSYVPSGMMPSGVLAFEECQLNIEKTESSLVNVSVQGTITGMETNDTVGVANTGVSKFTNASAYYDAISSHLYTRARQNAGLTWLHPMPKSTSVGKLPNAGQITYNYNFDNRPPNLIPGSISEKISIEDTYPGQVISETPVIGRNQAILQYMGARTNYKRSLQISVLMDRLTPNWSYSDVNSSGVWTGATAADIRNWIQQKPSLTQTSTFQKIFDAVNPANESGVIPTKTFYSEPKENWDASAGSYGFNVSWTYEKE